MPIRIGKNCIPYFVFSDMFVYKMKPAYRYGAATPWGGDALRRVFGKDIPDDHTGEALEASTLAGLESVLTDGRTLTACAGGPLPLLLKLLDARETLSVQVHPDDAYAAAYENGKRGKAEAWLILAAEPGAKIVYGLTPGTDVRALAGKDLEARLRWVEVARGDVFYIPPGMVHAIGAGILLYEIQQSSDVTYRFWDWNRRDPDGGMRPLHWDKACDVARADLRLSSTAGVVKPCEGGAVIRYLDTEHFTLMKLQARARLPLPIAAGFRFLTALGAGRLVQGNEALVFLPGETMYMPPFTEGVWVEGPCELLVSGPPIPSD
ncbi:MAG: class I mannose-6-phosphate isomerase [Firmicutes bacterium]|nr:class I mannose-6-phosphate isomerase [Bacillota bacterium]